ncbi:DUF3375 family protein [Cupriavidus sp. 2KB_3]|uniref:DUF3375 family protein n=1 Tax=Cupriavidus TaxID=106589 RepID=UPI0011EF085F|nr:DUF3375 family protein [Cupriavidus campinensis]
MRFDPDTLPAILQSIEARALALRDTPPAGLFSSIDETAARIDLPMERVLYQPPPAAALSKSLLKRRVEAALRGQPQVSLHALCGDHPLEHGLAELLTYLQLTGDTFHCVVDEAAMETVTWHARGMGGAPLTRGAQMPRVVFVRNGSGAGS